MWRWRCPAWEERKRCSGPGHRVEGRASTRGGVGGLEALAQEASLQLLREEGRSSCPQMPGTAGPGSLQLHLGLPNGCRRPRDLSDLLDQKWSQAHGRPSMRGVGAARTRAVHTPARGASGERESPSTRLPADKLSGLLSAMSRVLGCGRSLLTASPAPSDEPCGSGHEDHLPALRLPHLEDGVGVLRHSETKRAWNLRLGSGPSSRLKEPDFGFCFLISKIYLFIFKDLFI